MWHDVGVSLIKRCWTSKSWRKNKLINFAAFVCGYHVMHEYFDMLQATASTIDGDGWLRTDDLCSRN
jgi:acyl-CoA synthetase (AMP-forming)/AMP-acid ligase II